MNRRADEVLSDHLARRAHGDIDGDLKYNYASDVILLCEHGAFEGRDAVRTSAKELERQLPAGRHQILRQFVRDGYVLLIWRIESDGARAEHGVDTFVIRDGRIVMQSVFYKLVTEKKTD